MDGPPTWCAAAAAATAAADVAAGCGLGDRSRTAGVLRTSLCHIVLPARPAVVCTTLHWPLSKGAASLPARKMREQICPGPSTI